MLYRILFILGYPVQSYLPNPIPQPGQYIAAYPIGGYGVAGAAPQHAGIHPCNQPAPVQPVMNPSGPSNPASNPVQPNTGNYRINVYLSVT